MDETEQPEPSKRSKWARRVKRLRERHGWSQTKLARELEIEASTVSRWERGVFHPTLEQRRKMRKIEKRKAG